MGSGRNDEVIVGAGAYLELVKCFVNWSDLSTPYSKQHLQLIYNSIVDNWCTFSFDLRLKDIQKRLTSTLNKRILDEVREGIVYTKDISLSSLIFNIDYLDLILDRFFLHPSPSFPIGQSELEIYKDIESEEIKIQKTIIISNNSKEDRKIIENRERYIKNSLCVLCEENIELLRTIALLKKKFYRLKIKEGEIEKKISCVQVPMFTKNNFPGITKIDGLISGYAYVPIFSNDPYKNLYFQKSKGVREVKPIEDFYDI